MNKVRYIGTDDTQVRWGSNDDPRGLLIEGHDYTLLHEEVHTWHTKYHLAEFPGKRFNSVSFIGGEHGSDLHNLDGGMKP